MMKPYLAFNGERKINKENYGLLPTHIKPPLYMDLLATHTFSYTVFHRTPFAPPPHPGAGQ